MTNGVDVDQFRPDGENRHRVRAALGIPDNSVVLFCPRRAVPKCGIIYLAQSLRLLEAKQPAIAYFISFGDMENCEDLNRHIEYEDEVRKTLTAVASNVEVRLLTQIPNEEMLSFYHASDISILPSLVEATSIAGLESMACGLPLIGSSVGGIPDLIEHNRNGLLVPPADPEALAMAIDALVANPAMRITMEQQARERAVDRFSWLTIAQQTIDVYEAARPVRPFRKPANSGRADRSSRHNTAHEPSPKAWTWNGY